MYDPVVDVKLWRGTARIQNSLVKLVITAVKSSDSFSQTSEAIWRMHWNISHSGPIRTVQLELSNISVPAIEPILGTSWILILKHRRLVTDLLLFFIFNYISMRDTLLTWATIVSIIRCFFQFLHNIILIFARSYIHLFLSWHWMRSSLQPLGALVFVCCVWVSHKVLKFNIMISIHQGSGKK